MNPSTLRSWRVLLPSAAGVLALFFVGIRFVPCMVSAGPATWKLWAVVAPNMVCSLDLHGHPELTAEELESIGAFSNLQSLDLSGNALSRVPDSVFGLGKLQSLQLNGNALSVFPSISQMTSLQSLGLSENDLQTLPDLRGLTQLRSLDIGGNAIADISPGSLPPDLEIIDVSGNPLDEDEQDELEDEVPDVIVTSGGSSSSAPDASPPPATPPPPPATSSAGQPPAPGGGTGTSSSAGTGEDPPEYAPPSSLPSPSPVPPPPPGTPASSSSAPGAPVPPGAPDCTHNFQVLNYSICLPQGWHADANGNILDAEGQTMAGVQCPIQQSNYNEYTLTTRSRTYVKDGETYGTDLWSGTNAQGEGLLLLFLHLHEFNSWFGDNYEDVDASCQIMSQRPLQDQEIFNLLYLSVQ